jgi:hypothetical protein
MKIYLSLLLFCLAALSACKKNDLTGPDNCIPFPNDTLQLVYPCNGQINFLLDRFEWKVGEKGKLLEGFLELHISVKKEHSPLSPGSVYTAYGWSTYDRTLTQHSDKSIALLPNTTYEWYMTFRHDGNNLHFNTPVQTFVTGETGYRIPDFQRFTGTFTCQDTLYQKVEEWVTRYERRFVELPPVAQGTKQLVFTTLPNQAIYTYTTGSSQHADTLTSMQLSIRGIGEYKVTINDKGEFHWGNGNYYTPTSISGKVSGDLIRLSKITLGYQTPTYTSNRYTGKRN